MNRLASTGETAEPYEQCWVMRSVRSFVPGEGVLSDVLGEDDGVTGGVEESRV
jgi:hypothetical protein